MQHALLTCPHVQEVFALFYGQVDLTISDLGTMLMLVGLEQRFTRIEGQSKQVSAQLEAHVFNPCPRTVRAHAIHAHALSRVCHACFAHVSMCAACVHVRRMTQSCSLAQTPHTHHQASRQS